MRHYYLSSSSEHYAVGIAEEIQKILIQLGDDEGEQIRLCLSESEAKHLVSLIEDKLTELKTQGE